MKRFSWWRFLFILTARIFSSTFSPIAFTLPRPLKWRMERWTWETIDFRPQTTHVERFGHYCEWRGRGDDRLGGGEGWAVRGDRQWRSNNKTIMLIIHNKWEGLIQIGTDNVSRILNHLTMILSEIRFPSEKMYCIISSQLINHSNIFINYVPAWFG